MRVFIGSVAGLLFAAMVAFAAEQTFTANVSGNCGQCKKRITKSAEKVDGVMEAKWDKKSKVMTVVYDDAVTSPDSVKKAVAASGHDVEDMKASNQAYEKLPECCQYRDGANTH